jgi:hypothetical protein
LIKVAKFSAPNCPDQPAVACATLLFCPVLFSVAGHLSLLGFNLPPNHLFFSMNYPPISRSGEAAKKIIDKNNATQAEIPCPFVAAIFYPTETHSHLRFFLVMIILSDSISRLFPSSHAPEMPHNASLPCVSPWPVPKPTDSVFRKGSFFL